MVRELFIVGPGRTGTTFLLSTFNRSPDIFLFSELNAFALRRKAEHYAAYGGNGFAEQFNSRKVKQGGIQHKGTYIPPGVPSASVDELFQWISTHYKVFGEKIALVDAAVDGVAFQQI